MKIEDNRVGEVKILLVDKTDSEKTSNKNITLFMDDCMNLTLPHLGENNQVTPTTFHIQSFDFGDFQTWKLWFDDVHTHRRRG